MLSEVSAQLADVGRQELLFEITNLECQLHELHLNLMQSGSQLSPATRKLDPAEQLSKRARANLRAARRSARIPTP
jgi:hypothetical protein